MAGNRSAILFQGAVGDYRLEHSIFAGNKHVYASGFGPPVNFQPLPDATLALPESALVLTGKLSIEMDQSKRNYLHLADGTEGADLGAGLFTKSE